jgi:glycosyltransferase involved in cell wall biosynthesis
MVPALQAAGQKVTVLGAYGKDHGWNREVYRVYDVGKPYQETGLAGRAWRRVLRALPYARARSRRRLVEEWTREFRTAIERLHRLEGVDLVEWHSNAGFFDRAVCGVVDVLRLHGAHLITGNYMGIPVPDEISQSEIRTIHGISNWIGVSAWSLQRHQDYFQTTPRNASVIYNPVDCDVFRPSQAVSRPREVLYVGTLCDDKGDVRVAEASNAFLQQFPDCRMTYIGRQAGDRIPLILARIKAEHHCRVEFTGSLPRLEVARRLREATVLALPSRSENCSMAYIEALASGLPVVAGNTTSNPEIVQHGRTGLLVDAEDPDSIADAVSTLLRNEGMCDELGRFGRKCAETKFSLQTCVRQTLSFYETCIRDANRTVASTRLQSHAVQ